VPSGTYSFLEGIIQAFILMKQKSAMSYGRNGKGEMKKIYLLLEGQEGYIYDK